MARFAELYAADMLKNMTAKEVIAEMNKADKKAPPIKREGSFYTWRKKGYEGFDPGAIDDEILGNEGKGT
jgi:hypothetical protein